VCAKDDQIRQSRLTEDRVDRRRVDHDHLHGVPGGADCELRQMLGRSRLRLASLRLELSDLLHGEVGGWLEPLGMDDVKPRLEPRRHHSGDRQRASRSIAEVHAHEDRLRWAV
jgi:hypothetical protein